MANSALRDFLSTKKAMRYFIGEIPFLIYTRKALGVNHRGKGPFNLETPCTTSQEMRRILSHSRGDAHLTAASPSSVRTCPKTKAPRREED